MHYLFFEIDSFINDNTFINSQSSMAQEGWHCRATLIGRFLDGLPLSLDKALTSSGITSLGRYVVIPLLDVALDP